MNFTNSPFERMMKEIPRPGRGGSDPCAGCRHLKECRGQNGRVRRSSAPIVEPRTSGQVAEDRKEEPT